MGEIYDFSNQIALEFSVTNIVASNVIRLLREGCTVPFIARYRKEMTNTMNEEVVAAIQKRLIQLEELEKRKEAVLKSIAEQEKLTPELESSIRNAKTIQDVEDLYLPYKPKRKTRAEMARQKGLEPLAKIIMSQKSDDVESLAQKYIDKEKGVETTKDALKGACDIMAEWVSENIKGRNLIRKIYHKDGVITSSVVKDKENEAKTYQQYFDWKEPIAEAPSHRILAMFRAESEGLLKVKLRIDEEEALKTLDNIFVKGDNASTDLVQDAIDDAWKRLLEPSLETEIRAMYKEKADEIAVKVFAENLRQLLLAAPLGQKRTLALDPGFRTGCKVVILNEYGALLHNETIFPHPPQNETRQAGNKIRSLVNAYKIDVIAIGNGTAGRETEDFIRGIQFDRDIIAVMVNESGASVYSASKVARDEFPEYDITVRGAVSIGRRLMDPLAELVKIDPKSIGVGQYQHDVNQKLLNEELGHVVESCVNAVGVELNSASEQLLSYVSGVGPQIASNIVKYRNENGGFKNRKQLLKVPRLGEKAYEQCAGFLRIHDAEQPLDASAVHPESYHIVEKMAKRLNVEVKDLIGNKDLIAKINPKEYIEEDFGIETVNDIIAELEKPGRDPRKTFEVFEFNKNVRTIKDLKVGMQLFGIVTNITAFGCFVDVGVHQDGLVHISQMSDQFIKDPNEIVKLNQKVNVRVAELDIERKRISLSMKNIK
ncbi:MAG: RNA-binding transcriptional accessory protein [Lentimicrobiaceae bacterium]|nr:RNA-binding transcriptional accessory protein [Lentimicrobiaceae bacterium]